MFSREKISLKQKIYILRERENQLLAFSNERRYLSHRTSVAEVNLTRQTVNIQNILYMNAARSRY